MSGDGECVGAQRSLSARIVEMDDGAVVLDHVDFLNALNLIHSEFLQCRLQLLVIRGRSLVHDLLLSSWSS